MRKGYGPKELKGLVEAAYENRKLLEDAEYVVAVNATVAMLNEGRLRVAEPTDKG